MSDYQNRNLDSDLGDTGATDMNTGEAGTSEQMGSQRRVQETLNQARERVSEKLTQAGDSVSRMSQDMREKLRGSMDRMRHIDRSEMNEMYDEVLENARRNPGRAILISAAVGIVLGMFLRGSRRDF